MNAMKASRLSSVLFAAGLLCSIPVFASPTVKKSLQINEAISVQGKQLQPGTYRFEWNEPGPNVEVKIMSHGKTVATVAANLVEEKTPNDQDGYALKPGPNGGNDQVLSQLFFHGQRYDLEIQNQGSNSNANPSGTSGNIK